MSTRKDSAKTRAFRPSTDALEGRQLLSGVVSGTDADGDAWVLRLIGPGSIVVVKQNGADGNPAPLNSQTEINSITIGGTDPLKTRVVGTVKKAVAGDGKVFFQNLTGLPARSESSPSVGQGLVSIDAPSFWLGNTTPVSAVTASTSPPRIALPDGVETLRFGGVDTTHDQAPATSTTQSDTADVVLGLPRYGGSRVIIDRSISSSQSVAGTPSATDPNPAPRIVQHGVVFAAGGRLSAFQANAIDGDAAHPPGQFGNQSTAATGSGGTTVVSTSPGGSFFPSGVLVKGLGTGGQIGFLNVGGNATNFTTVVEDPTGGDTAKISNYYIGGETTNVMLIAPDGSRNVEFGKGMDTVEIRSHVINTLKANRGAVGSTVAVDRQISRADFGGDVVNTNVLSGYNQNYVNIINTVSGASTSIFGGGTPAPPPLPLNAETSGGFDAHIAGDVMNSVFAASVQPFDNTFGGRNQLVLPTGHINAKVEGTIDNSTATPDAPTTAFYAAHVSLTKAPVTPPAVSEAPFTHPSVPYFLPGVHQTVRKTTTQTLAAASASKPIATHATAQATAKARETPSRKS